MTRRMTTDQLTAELEEQQAEARAWLKLYYEIERARHATPRDHARPSRSARRRSRVN